MENCLIGANCHDHEIDKQGVGLKVTMGPMVVYELKQKSEFLIMQDGVQSPREKDGQMFTGIIALEEVQRTKPGTERLKSGDQLEDFWKGWREGGNILYNNSEVICYSNIENIYTENTQH